MSLLKTNEIQNYNGSSLTLTASTVSTSAQLNTGGNISVTGSLNVSDDSTTRTNLGLGTIATQDSDSITVTGGSVTGTEIDLKSSGTTIFKSDGTTAVLSESGGVVTLNNGTIGSGVQFPAGHVIQVIDSGAQTTTATNTTTSFADGNCTATITPTSASNKILLFAVQEIQVWNTGYYATGRWKIQRNIGGGAFSDIYIDSVASNGNVFAFDYGGSGINVYRPTSYTLTDSPNTTSVLIYKTQIALGTNGGQLIGTNGQSPGRMILMEISA